MRNSRTSGWLPRWRASGAAAAVFASALAAAAAGGDEPFAIQLLPQRGRTTAAELADFDGDGRGDLFVCVFSGVPGRERRELELYFQRDDGSLPSAPDLRAELPPGAAAYDLAEFDAQPGHELLFLARDRVAVLSFAGRSAATRELALPAPSVAVTHDERGIDRMALVRSGFGPKPRLLIPGLAEALLLADDGTPIARLATGARANYFLPTRDGALASESEVELYLDVPRLTTGDVDGDGRGDVVATSRYALLVFLQRADGSFANAADRAQPITLIEAEDFVRQSGSVRAEVADLDADGRVDLLLAHTRGGLLGATTTTMLFRNRDGRFDLARPDQRFESGGKGTVTHQLLDLDRDGRPELLEARIPLGALDLVELLVTRHLDAEVAIRRATAVGGGAELFETEPFFQRELSIAISFETLRPRGFIPTFNADLTGDGTLDLLGAGDGEALEIFSGRDGGYRQRSARQPLDTSGRIRFGQLRAGGLTDFVIYDPRRPEAPVRIGANRGVLAEPGGRSIPELRAQEPPAASPPSAP